MGFRQRFTSIWLRRPVWLIVIPIIAGVSIPLLHRATKTGPPVVELPGVIDLGKREIGDVVVVPFSIANRGGEKLVIDDIRTSCSCSGIEREIDGKFFRIECLNLGAGERAALVIRAAVRGVPAGNALHIVVHFRTNDPTTPAAQVEAVVGRVLAGVNSSPRSVSLGTVAVNDKVRRLVVIRDTATPPRTIQELISSMPDRVTARLLPAAEWPRDREPQGASNQGEPIHVQVDKAPAG
jgi:hypothetical protein